MAASVTEIADSFFRPSVQGLVPYEPGKPVEEVQRELGLARCVKLASNEGPFGPFPAALEALARSVQELNRYPDGGAWRLRTALAERLGVAYEEVAVGAGADGLIDCLSQASLDPGRGGRLRLAVVPQLRDRRRQAGGGGDQGSAARPPLRPRRDAGRRSRRGRTSSTCATRTTRRGRPTPVTELDAFLDRVPANVLVVIDQAYREYIDDPDYPDAIEEYFKAGRPVAVLRTFSKIYGLAGLRVGYMVAQPAVVTAVNKVKRAFDVSTAAQEAALASLDAPDEIARRRALNAEARDQVAATLAAAGFEVAGPAVANFVYAETGADTRPLFEALLAQGVIVRPLHGFGSRHGHSGHCGDAGRERLLRGRARPRARRPPGALTSPLSIGLARQREVLRASRSFRLLFGSTLISGLGTWIAVVALVIDIKDRTGSAVWVSALLIADFLPGSRHRPAARAARRPALAEAPARRRRRDAARGVRLARVCGQCLADRRARADRGDRLRLCPAGCVRRPPEPRLRGDAPPRELAATHRRPVDDHGRHARRRSGRRRLGARSRVLAERRQLPLCRRVSSSRSRPRSSSRARRRATGTGRTSPRASVRSVARMPSRR